MGEVEERRVEWWFKCGWVLVVWIGDSIVRIVGEEEGEGKWVKMVFVSMEMVVYCFDMLVVYYMGDVVFLFVFEEG